MALFCTPCGHQTVLMQQISNLRPITAGFRGHLRPPDPKDHQREPTGMVPDPRQTTAAQARTIIRHVSRRSRHGRTVRNRPCAGRRRVAETIDAKPALRPQSGHFGEIVRRGLIHPIQPIAPQQIRVRSPCEQRLKVRIVMREVVVRERDVAHPLRHVALVLLLERRLAVLPMAESEHFGEIASGDQARPGLRTK